MINGSGICLFVTMQIGIYGSFSAGIVGHETNEERHLPFRLNFPFLRIASHSLSLSLSLTLSLSLSHAARTFMWRLSHLCAKQGLAAARAKLPEWLLTFLKGQQVCR